MNVVKVSRLEHIQEVKCSRTGATLVFLKIKKTEKKNPSETESVGSCYDLVPRDCIQLNSIISKTKTKTKTVNQAGIVGNSVNSMEGGPFCTGALT